MKYYLKVPIDVEYDLYGRCTAELDINNHHFYSTGYNEDTAIESLLIQLDNDNIEVGNADDDEDDDVKCKCRGCGGLFYSSQLDPFGYCNWCA